mgnify:CR=1 FL=1
MSRAVAEWAASATWPVAQPAGQRRSRAAQPRGPAGASSRVVPGRHPPCGGEISRIMLALKKALAAGADTCILVFDEIDTGISGRVADVVLHHRVVPVEHRERLRGRPDRAHRRAVSPRPRRGDHPPAGPLRTRRTPRSQALAPSSRNGRTHRSSMPRRDASAVAIPCCSMRWCGRCRRACPTAAGPCPCAAAPGDGVRS